MGRITWGKPDGWLRFYDVELMPDKAEQLSPEETGCLPEVFVREYCKEMQ